MLLMLVVTLKLQVILDKCSFTIKVKRKPFSTKNFLIKLYLTKKFEIKGFYSLINVNSKILFKLKFYVHQIVNIMHYISSNHHKNL